MRIVFMGTPEYAAINLQALINAGYQVAGVISQPDRPKGRGGKIVFSAVKLLALRHSIPVFQPKRIRKDGLEDLKALKPDLCVTAAFGQILSEEILAVPPLGTVNVHASLLPKYRGSSPANWAIIKGETVTGVTTMLTDKGIDTGDILLQEEVAIRPDETAGVLTIRLAHTGASLLLETLARIVAGNCPRTRQNEAEMSYYPLLTKETGEINWQQSAADIVNLVRGVNPWPGAGTHSPWGQLKILSAREERTDSEAASGTILMSDARNGLLVKAGDAALRIGLLQLPGGKAMDSRDFLRGHPLDVPGTMNNEEVKP
jgi:methionyl-tRNA formyltransferase